MSFMYNTNVIYIYNDYNPITHMKNIYNLSVISELMVHRITITKKDYHTPEGKYIIPYEKNKYS